MAAPPRPAIRRPISIAVVYVATIATSVASVVVLPVLVLVDVVTRARLRRTRVWCLVVGALLNESLGLVGAFALTLWHVGRLDGPTAQDRFHRLEWWWAGRHAANLRVFAGVRWMVENPALLRDGHAIVLARHASHVDSILPVVLFGCAGRRRLRYTLKDDLQWAPAMDIVGNRLPNVFVDRTPDGGDRLAARLEALVADLGDDVAVIFPEGTFFTPQRRDRAATRIAETRPDLEDAVRSLDHVLPPRPAGTEALMAGAPDADIVFVAHEGMEAFGDLRTIVGNLPLESPVRVRLWRTARADVPTDDVAGWLLDQWIELDRWIQKRVIERRDSDGTPPSLIGAEEIRP